MEKKTTQAERARMGAIGESHVVAKLMEQGWDAFNANCTIKNFKTIDIRQGVSREECNGTLCVCIC